MRRALPVGPDLERHAPMQLAVGATDDVRCAAEMKAVLARSPMGQRQSLRFEVRDGFLGRRFSFST